MYPVYKSLGVKEECKDVKVQFPPQHQECQPGLEYIMMPRPISNNPYSRGSGKLQGKVAIITGGDSGIGRAIAYAFAKEGADITISYLNEEEDACETKAFVEQIGRRCLLVPGDLKNEEMSKIVVEKTIECFGKIDILVNNFGTTDAQKDKNLVDGDTDTFFDTVNTNLKSVYLPCKAVVPYMIENGGGSIINISTIGSIVPDLGRLGYVVSKSGVNALTENIAVQYARHNIRCNAVLPGLIATDAALNNMSQEFIDSFLKHVPLNRFGLPTDIANAVLFLASDESSFITGEILSVAGGFAKPSPLYGDNVRG